MDIHLKLIAFGSSFQTPDVHIFLFINALQAIYLLVFEHVFISHLVMYMYIIKDRAQ